ncbi:MAG TPA: amidohydrolase [Porticoccaceae bacterium]|nr:amidohydrolase [Porticoccaceae bacterium]
MRKPGISADSHIVEPPNTYIDFIDPKFRDRAPQMVEGPGGVHIFNIPGLDDIIPLALLGAAGVPAEDLAKYRTAKFDELPNAAWNPKFRAEAQDRDGVCAEIIYASVGMVMCSHKDFEYKTACMRAYNRWLQTFCEGAPGRLFGLAQTSVESVDEAIKDVEEAKKMGFVGMMMPGKPKHEDYDHEDYNALWQACVDLDMPVCFHILTSEDSGVKEVLAPKRGHPANGFMNIVRGVQDVLGVFLFGGVFEDNPNLKMVIAEADAGWIPHYAYRADHAIKRLGPAVECKLTKMPSEYLTKNVSYTFQDDLTAYQNLGVVDSGCLMWANDYPHTDASWPNSQNILNEQMAHLTEEQQNACTHDNVKKLFNLPVNV